MEEEVKKDKTVLYKFVKSFFREEEGLPYALILQINQRLAIEGEFQNIKSHLITLLNKCTKKRFKRFKTNKIKRNKLPDKGTEVVKNIVLEYVWLNRMTDVFKKIFFTFDNFGEFPKNVNEKINRIVSKNGNAIVEELSRSIYEYELSKEDPKYAVLVTKTEDLKCNSSKDKFSDLEYIFITLEIFKDIEVGQFLFNRIIANFINTWTDNVLNDVRDVSELNTRIESLRRNVVLSNNLHSIEKEIVTKLFKNISISYLLICLGFKDHLISIDYYLDLIDKDGVFSSFVDEYVRLRYKKNNLVNCKQEKFIELIEDVDKNYKQAKDNQRKVFLKKISGRLQEIRRIDLYSKDIKMVYSQFGELFRFWLETLAFKKEVASIKSRIEAKFKKFINDDELSVIKCISKGINDFMTSKTDIVDFYRYAMLKEASVINTLFDEDLHLFKITNIISDIVCLDLLCPISVVLKDISVELASLDEKDLLIFLRKSIFKFIGDVFEIVNDKDSFELTLRENLAVRLFSETSSITEEEELVSYCNQNNHKDVRSKLETMIFDFKERNVFKNCEIMLLRRFQCPEFSTYSLSFNELDGMKKEYAERLLEKERKKIVWLDSLSSCEAEIEGRPVRLSLIQYNIVLNVIENKPMNEENLSVENKTVYNLHLNELLTKKLIIRKDSEFEINQNFIESDFIPRCVVLKGETDEQKLEDDKKFSNSLIDCKIVKACKRAKTVSITELSSKLEIERSVTISRLEILQKKGFVEVSGEEVTYVP